MYTITLLMSTMPYVLSFPLPLPSYALLPPLLLPVKPFSCPCPVYSLEHELAHKSLTDIQAHPGSQASNASGLHSQQVAGNADSNTSTSIKGAGATTTEPAAAALGGEEFNLKTPRKQEGSAHAAAGGHIHGQGEEHAKAE
jgi:hypothetical protein